MNAAGAGAALADPRIRRAPPRAARPARSDGRARRPPARTGRFSSLVRLDGGGVDAGQDEHVPGGRKRASIPGQGLRARAFPRARARAHQRPHPSAPPRAESMDSRDEPHVARADRGDEALLSARAPCPSRARETSDRRGASRSADPEAGARARARAQGWRRTWGTRYAKMAVAALRSTAQTNVGACRRARRGRRHRRFSAARARRRRRPSRAPLPSRKAAVVVVGASTPFAAAAGARRRPLAVELPADRPPPRRRRCHQQPATAAAQV